MDRKETMDKINEMTKLLVAQEDEWKKERGKMHMIQLEINHLESQMGSTRGILGKLHQHLAKME